MNTNICVASVMYCKECNIVEINAGFVQELILTPCGSPFSGTSDWPRSLAAGLVSWLSAAEAFVLDSDVSGGAKVSSNHWPKIGSLSSSVY